MSGLAKLAADITTKELLKADKRKNEAPNPHTIKGRWNQPENFARGWNVKTKFKPVIDEGEGTVGYQTTAAGFGRRNQWLTAEKNYNDIPSFFLENETPGEYEARRAANIGAAAQPKLMANMVGNITNVAAPIAGAAVGAHMGGRIGALTGGGLGLGGGIVANALARYIGRKKMNEQYLDSLDPRERTILGDFRQHDLDTLPQNAQLATRLRGENYYMI